MMRSERGLFTERPVNRDLKSRESFVLDMSSRRLLDELARLNGATKAEVMRQALTAFSREVGDGRSRAGSRGETSRLRNGRESAQQRPDRGLLDDGVSVPLDATERAKLAELSLTTTSLVVPERKVAGGTLVRANTVIWNTIVDALRRDWSQAYDIPPHKFEELIAGAFEREGYDEVTLTPRSGDKGRDVIAVKRGMGSVKVIGSVKRYAQNRPVRYDDVRALMGVLSSEVDSSKGMVITTSRFPDKLAQAEEFARFIPTRLELMDGGRTLDWLSQLCRR